jgi:2-polyprenyl-3-methyl-5-hydroxy-6-metoxy-1,4-benzoquinol methylase
MNRFSNRSYAPEIMDDPNVPSEDMFLTLRELDKINTFLGGHHVTIKGLKNFIGNNNPIAVPKPIHIVEIGCGGGDNLRMIRDWCSRNNTPVLLEGIDMNADCIQYAKSQSGSQEFRWQVCDYRKAQWVTKPDIIFSSLFCHHFTDTQLVDQIKWMKNNAVRGFFINDLHRHPLAYLGIRLLSTLLAKSYLIRHDGPLSVLRAFKRSEWNKIFSSAGIHQFSLSWHWAFRWLLINKNMNE